jgi:hypothetical protein
MPRKQKGPKHLATAPRQALAEAKGAAGTAPAAATGTAAAGIAAPLALATLACAVAALVGSGILLQQQGSAEQPGAAWSATRRAELEGLKLPELVALVGESSDLHVCAGADCLVGICPWFVVESAAVLLKK